MVTVHNGKSQPFEFELIVQKRKQDSDIFMECKLVLITSPPTVDRTKLIWDLVAVEVEVGIIERPMVLLCNMSDVVRVCPVSRVQKINSDALTLMVNIKV